ASSPKIPHSSRGTFQPYQGHAYLIPFKYFDGPLDAARLYEDDRLLGPASSPMQEIIDKGAGRFELHLDRTNLYSLVLVLSTSDNTNPNTNGRKYHLK
ncbi:hypothetical protein, partial [Bradyrhizobium elkanii]|uniref:hypothetical protein n=1 Tax=Bradyrhizobium elkanii TaxID=29448 RepID=UPI001AEC5043